MNRLLMVSIHARLATGDRKTERRDLEKIVSIHARSCWKSHGNFQVSIHARLATGDGKSSEPAPTNTEHPHVRGENFVNHRTDTRKPGTSPRAWGKQFSALWHRAYNRNIPTCVGKTQAVDSQADDTAEHPHVRGENKAQRRPMSP